jgi:hypothetical protein
VSYVPSTPRGNTAESANDPDAGETAYGSESARLVDIDAAPLTPEDEEILEEARKAALMTDDPLGYEQEIIDALQDEP